MKVAGKKVMWMKRLSAVTLTVVMALTLLLSDALTLEALAAAALADPKITITAAAAKVNPVSKQLVTWDCIWLGVYPQREVISEEMCGDNYENYTSVNSAYFNAANDVIVSTDVYEYLSDTDNESEWSNNQITWNGETYLRMTQEDAAAVNSGSSYYSWSDAAAYHYFKYEPIKWRVLSVSGNQATLLADVVLDNRQFNPDFVAVIWEESMIRSWMNSTFMNNSFTSAEQSAIQTTDVINGKNIQWQSTVVKPNTLDQVFLPSQAEVYTTAYGFSKNYYPSIQDEARRCKSSTYAKAMGISSSTTSGYEGNCIWWCRTQGRVNSYAVYVNPDGSVFNDGVPAYNYYGIRPAMTVNLSVSDAYYYAGTVSSDGTKKEISKEASIVRTQLAALPEADAVMLASEDEILAAREAYDGLTKEQQRQIEETFSAKLTEAEGKLAELKQQVMDVRERINALPEAESVTLEDRTEINAANEAYNILTEEQKAQIDDTLSTKLEAVIDKLVELEQPIINMQEKLDALPETDDVTLGSEDAITAARETYDALKDAEKEWVDLTKLTDAEMKLAELKQGIADVQGLIGALPETAAVMLGSEDAITAAREAYMVLTEEQQGRIDITKLTANEEKLAKLKQEIIDAQEKMDALPEADTVTLGNGAAILAARKAYDALTPEQQAQNSNLAKLTEAEAKLAELMKPITQVQDLINAVPETNRVTLTDEPKIAAAKAAYERLTSEQKKYVTGYDRVLAAEKRLNEIKPADTNSTNHANSANHTSNTNNTSQAASYVKLNVSKAPLQLKKSTTAIKVTSIGKGDKVVSWKSSNTKVATVTSKGKIKARKVGKAKITVTTKKGAKAACTITVQKAKVKTKSLKVDTGAKLILKKGKKATITVTRNPITATEKLTYKSSDRKVASVTKKGVVKAKKKGSCKITVKSSNGKKKIIKVTVK